MKRFLSRSGFTLVEVNLAIFIMSVGVLSMCGLYALGYRENRQSEEDVYATAYADSYLAPLVAGLSSPRMKWSEWTKIGEEVSSEARTSGIDARWPGNGWRDYVNTRTRDNGSETTYRVISNPKGKADDVFGKVKGAISASGVTVATPSIPSDYQYGLVVTRCGSVIQLAFRMARRTQSLISQPIFVQEIRFQGGFGEGGN